MQVLGSRNTKYVHIPEQKKVDNYEDFSILHANNLTFGCDGTVLKREDSLYEFKRTRTWLKVKPVKTFDCLVLGIEPGKGKYVGMVGALPVRMEGGVPITRVSGMTDAQRVEWWLHPRKILNKTIEVEARGVHKSGKLIEPRFVRIRDDK